jgi:hypothetical protein
MEERILLGNRRTCVDNIEINMKYYYYYYYYEDLD